MHNKKVTHLKESKEKKISSHVSPQFFRDAGNVNTLGFILKNGIERRNEF